MTASRGPNTRGWGCAAPGTGTATESASPRGMETRFKEDARFFKRHEQRYAPNYFFFFSLSLKYINRASPSSPFPPGRGYSQHFFSPPLRAPLRPRRGPPCRGAADMVARRRAAYANRMQIAPPVNGATSQARARSAMQMRSASAAGPGGSPIGRRPANDGARREVSREWAGTADRKRKRRPVGGAAAAARGGPAEDAAAALQGPERHPPVARPHGPLPPPRHAGRPGRPHRRPRPGTTPPSRFPAAQPGPQRRRAAARRPRHPLW